MNRYWLVYLLAGLAVTVLTAIAAGVMLRQPTLDVKNKLVRDGRFSGQCQHISGNDIRNGTAFEGTVSLSQLRDDLLIHIHMTDSPLLCAQHVGLPLCYCVKRLDPLATVGPRPSRGAYEELFNINLYSMTVNTQHNSHEEPYECERDYWCYRFDFVWASYQDASGAVIKRKFEGLDSDLLQYAMEVLYNLPSRCGAADATMILSAFFDQAANVAPVPTDSRPQLGY
jgi:hypothetical protein